MQEPPDEPAGPGRLTSYQYIGNTTDLEPTLLDHCSLERYDGVRFPSVKIRRIGPGCQFVKFVDHVGIGSTNTGTVIQDIEAAARPHNESLIRVYMAKLNPVFPLLAQGVLWQSYKSRTIDPALLAAIYAISSRFLDTEHGQDQAPNAARLEDLAWKYYEASLDSPRLATIQAGLLLAQFSTRSSHFLTTQLISIGFDLCLQQDCSEWRVDGSERKLRKRLAWLLYAQDKWSSLRFGRPSHITPANWNVPLLSEEDFEVVDSPVGSASLASPTNHSASLVIQMIMLTMILAELLDTFYTLKAQAEIQAAGPQGLRRSLEKAKPVQMKLKDWFSRLPNHLKMDTSIGDERASSNGILHLAYFAAEISLHRNIIRAAVYEGTDEYLAYICRSAAKTRLISAMDFVNRLRPVHLKSYWPLSSISNFALIGAFGVLLRATAATIEEAEFYRMRNEEFQWTLGVSSKTADFLKYAIDSLNLNNELSQNVPIKPTVSEIMVRADMRDAVVVDGQPVATTGARYGSISAASSFASPTSSSGAGTGHEFYETAANC